jgi:hypothetical protein
MNLQSTLQTIFVSAAHALALGSFFYYGIMGGIHFDTLNEVQVSFLDKMLFYAAPLFAIKISDVINTIRSGGK